jgi:hypothetical protein
MSLKGRWQNEKEKNHILTTDQQMKESPNFISEYLEEK